MSRFKDIAHALLSSSEPKPNPFEEEAKVLISDLEPAAKAQVLAQLAVVYEVNQLKRRRWLSLGHLAPKLSIAIRTGPHGISSEGETKEPISKYSIGQNLSGKHTTEYLALAEKRKQAALGPL